MLGLPDFDYVAEKVLDFQTYAAIRHGAGSESSYRYNLEAFDKFRFRPRVMVNITGVDVSFTIPMEGDVPNLTVGQPF
jgi:L-lactate dehydrogenase (cytochrome)